MLPNCPYITRYPSLCHFIINNTFFRMLIMVDQTGHGLPFHVCIKSFNAHIISTNKKYVFETHIKSIYCAKKNICARVRNPILYTQPMQVIHNFMCAPKNNFHAHYKFLMHTIYHFKQRINQFMHVINHFMCTK